MTTTAIIMMVLFMAILWGGLAVSILHFIRHPDEESGELGGIPGSSNMELVAQED